VYSFQYSTKKKTEVSRITSHHLFSFRKSVEDYVIHMDMEIVIFVGIKG